MKTKQLALASVIGLSGFALNCSGSDADCNETRTCAAIPDGDAGGTDGSSGGTDGGVPIPPGCDPTADAKDAPKCVVNEFGVFVDAAKGNDGNSGSKELPMKTIGGALGKLNGKSRVYVCEGTYAESVKVTSAVSIYGGFACADWSYSGVAAKVAPSARGVALSIANASSAIVVSDLEVTAQDASDPGESSVAMFVASSSKVTFRRVKATAGKGTDGKDATDAADFTPPAAPDGTGGAAGGTATPNPACTTSIGGAGGNDATANGGAGKTSVTPTYPVADPPWDGAGGTNCFAGAAHNGSYGTAGGAGAGAAKVGSLSAQGWKGSDGAAGGKGGDGQGGGGGAQVNTGGIGGSGGPGGCGGVGGGNGTAGGSSIALAVFESEVLLETTTLATKDAGRGGKGAKGQKGQLAGTKGASNGPKACDGGYGGIGGSGGGGGGGAGGVSAGIVYKGSAPVIEGTATPTADTHASVTLGQKGAGGGKGAGGDAADPGDPPSRAGLEGTDGVPGEAKAVLKLE